MKLKTGEWDLSSLVKNPKSEEMNDRLSRINSLIKSFEETKSLLNQDISPVEFVKLIRDSEIIAEELSLVTSYAYLKYAENTSSNISAGLVTKLSNFATEATNKLLFFDLWFKKILDDYNANRLVEGAPSVYRDYLVHERSMSKYTLNESEEKIINILDVTGMNALIKIYDRLSNSFEFEYVEIKGKKKVKKHFTNKEKLISLVRSSRSSERVAAYKALLSTYKKNSGVLGEIYLNRILNWHNEFIELRKFPTPISVRNLSNNISDESVTALLNVCKLNSKVFQRYFTEKAKMLGIKKLERYHLYAPLKTQKRDTVEYGKALKIVLEAFEGFHPEFKTIVQTLITKKHIHSKLQDNKQSGAFCSTVSPSIEPYVLLNFDGTLRDISTMAHEFGHAIHSVLASDKPISVQHPSLPLAETASVFGEMILNDKLLNTVPKKEKRILLAEQIDDFYATIMRQAYFTIFEIDAHKMVGRDSATTTDQLCDLYLDNLKTQFGTSMKLSDDFKYEWLYIPHFYHSPFYCYAYSFGNLLVLSLYQQFKKEGNDFIPKYLSILSSGGSRKPEDLLQESEIDITKESFWQKGFDFVSENIQTLKNAE
ncbi:M3 family oligoendopeptidase [Candidatus Nitrosocosmicus hydrocola]|uniref:M3 family oligoendopeptidase n=1 Tax=Candidatus Nitrosocosmicus hydrocola TaxID=1826872 RepID=UPI001E2E8CAB|nr:M3 family oligoendopeptidase [Candidatus Nitrosocosmicus hydrocola]